MNSKLIHSCLLAALFCACSALLPEPHMAIEPVPAGRIADAPLDDKPSAVLITSSGSEDLQWNLRQVQAPKAWDIIPGGQGIVVAVLDTGIDASHPELAGRVVDSLDLTGSPGSGDLNGHGTHMAGIIAARAGEMGITGAAYNCSLLDIKTAENDGSTDAEKIARGILWAVNRGARVINVSLTVNRSYPLLEYAAAYAWNHNCLIVAAAGNSFSKNPVYPASYPNVVSVAATDKKDALAKWSNRGEWITVAAPGVDIYSTVPGDAYAVKNGSSCSTALVSGEAALLFAGAVDLNNNGRINDEVYDALVRQSDTIRQADGPVQRVNIYKATLSAVVGSGEPE